MAQRRRMNRVPVVITKATAAVTTDKGKLSIPKVPIALGRKKETSTIESVDDPNLELRVLMPTGDSAEEFFAHRAL
jgi:hypothetical protein